MPFKNVQGITEIAMKPKFRAYCPLGKAWYSGEFGISVTYPEMIPDYCDVDKAVAEIDGSETIIEDAVAKVFACVADQVRNGDVSVKCVVNDAAHMPVVVEKEAAVKNGVEVGCE